MNETIITAKNLNFGYSKSSNLLENINLELGNGHIHGLLGKNGEGKSTLLKLICGLLFPKNGDMNVLNFTPQKRQPAFLQEVYFLPEELPNFSLKIEEYEKMNAPFYPKYSKEQFDNYLSEFGIVSKTDYLDKLSLGQKKKVLISFGLATNTNLLIMDEPTNGLDIPSKTQFRKMVAAAIDETKCIIISTHQVRDLESLIDSIVIMDNHKILLNEPVEKITEKLLFTIDDKNPDAESVLYSTDTIRGKYQVQENTAGQDSKLDIEMLFYTILSNRERIAEIFSRNKLI